jgi:YegS/Rv2252/BmrU family lipid kinase
VAGRVFETLRHEGVESDVVMTERAGHAGELARERAEGYDAVFVVGGDGTAMEVVTGLPDDGPPLGILPGGTGNVLARSLSIPLGVGRAVHALVRGAEARLDLGQLPDGRQFAIGLGTGLDEQLIAGASHALKRRIGVWAYIWSGTKAAIRLEQFDVRLTVDGTTHERRVASVLVANLGTTLGGLIRFGRGITHDDGILTVCLFSPTNFWHVLRIFARMVLGTADRDPRVHYVSGKAIRLETNPIRDYQADGEMIGRTPVDIVVRPRAARVLIPRRDPRNS